MESILNSIKKLLGYSADNHDFDSDIIIHINSTLFTLNQLGVGTSKVFRIEDEIATWSEFLDESEDFEAVKTYVYLKVKLIFDPPLSSSVTAAMENTAKEYEFRLNVASENKAVEIQNGEQ